MASAILQITSGEHAGQTFLMEGPMTVGRDTGVQIRINDRSISRKHARIEQRDGSFYVVDLGSQNGTKLDGAIVTESPLPDTCKLQFGGIEADFNVVSGETAPAAQMPVPVSAPDRPGDDSEWESIPPDGQSILDDIFRPPDGLDEIDEREAKRKAEAREKLFGLAYILTMILILIAGVLIFKSIGNTSSIPQQAIVLHKFTKVHGEFEGERLVPYRGRGRFAGIEIEDKAIAEVTVDTHYDWLLCARGLEVGETKVRLISPANKVLAILTVIVKGEKPVPREKRGYVPDEDRIREAALLAEQADVIRDDSPWRAMKLYERAAALCKPIVPRPALYNQATTEAREVRKHIRDKVKKLKESARLAKGEPPAAVKYLNDICRLIPDIEDKEHQRAKIIIHAFYPEMTYKPSRGKGR